MDLLKDYGEDNSDEDNNSEESKKVINLPSVDLAPSVVIVDGTKYKGFALIDPKTKELQFNPKYEELFQPEAGPSNPFKSERQKAQKNMLTGFVETAFFNDFHFERSIRSYDTLGYAHNPSAEAATQFVGDKIKATEEKGESLFESKKTGGEKRKRVANYDASNVESYTGPWAKYENEKTIAKPDPELQKEMDEIVRKRKLKSRAGRKAAQEEQHMTEETSTLHIKEDSDYLNRSWMDAPKYTGTNLRADFVPNRCFPPTKQEFVYNSHSKAVNAIRWLPKSAHLFLSCSMDNKIKIWEVFGNRKLIRTYNGHKMPVRDICFNNDGTEFLSTSFDNYMKLWDTETDKNFT